MKIAPFFLLHRTTKSPRMRALIFCPSVSRSLCFAGPPRFFFDGVAALSLVFDGFEPTVDGGVLFLHAAWGRGGRLLRKKRLFLRFARPFNRKITPFVLQVLRIVSFLLE